MSGMNGTFWKLKKRFGKDFRKRAFVGNAEKGGIV